jgi:hypothetical protein
MCAGRPTGHSAGCTGPDFRSCPRTNTAPNPALPGGA